MYVVVVGNGVAGNAAISAIREFDKQAQVTMISDESHPEYSACVLPRYLAGELGRQSVFLKRIKDYRREDVKIIFGQRAAQIDFKNREVLLEDRGVSYDKLILATGSKPVIPRLDGCHNEGIFTFKSLMDADKLSAWSGKVAVVVGSGPIGIEVAVALRTRGYEVFLVELLSRILPRLFDEYPASILTEILEKHGVRVLTRETVLRITGDGKVTGVITDKREINCDTVILALGMRPDVELARQAGLQLGELGGIKADEQMRTNVEDVYACGDCAETRGLFSGRSALFFLWHNAKQQGKVAGHNCIGNLSRYPGSINITGINIWGVDAVSVGSITSNFDQIDDIEIIEKRYGLNYSRLIISKGTLLGVQAIGRIKDIGILISAIARRENLSKLETRISIHNKWNLAYNIWGYRLGQYVRH